MLTCDRHDDADSKGNTKEEEEGAPQANVAVVKVPPAEKTGEKGDANGGNMAEGGTRARVVKDRLSSVLGLLAVIAVGIAGDTVRVLFILSLCVAEPAAAAVRSTNILAGGVAGVNGDKRLVACVHLVVPHVEGGAVDAVRLELGGPWAVGRTLPKQEGKEEEEGKRAYHVVNKRKRTVIQNGKRTTKKKKCSDLFHFF